jgi:hypothetical protein
MSNMAILSSSEPIESESIVSVARTGSRPMTTPDLLECRTESVDTGFSVHPFFLATQNCVNLRLPCHCNCGEIRLLLPFNSISGDYPESAFGFEAGELV